MSGKNLLIWICSCFCLLPVSVQAVTHQVTIGDNFFSPNNLTINVGDTVHWSYSGGMLHDATADDGSWSSPTSSNINYSRTFNSVGEVLYHCSVHSLPGRNINTNMNGRINVIQANANQAPTANFSFSCTDLDCDFTDLSTDSDGTVASWSWNFDDGGASSSRNPAHSYAAAGTYAVSLTATDDGGAQDSIIRNVTVSAAPPATIAINGGMTDAWYDPATDGQGMLIMVWDSIDLVFMAWFTFDTERPPVDATAILGEPGHRWLTASGPFEGDTATLNIYLTAGGIFDAGQPPAITDQEPIGTATIKWTSCNAGILSYDIPSLNLSGDIAIERIVEAENVLLCEAGQ
ncbi:PKD domain-containing protein [Pseudomonadota bacterium]